MRQNLISFVSYSQNDSKNIYSKNMKPVMRSTHINEYAGGRRVIQTPYNININPAPRNVVFNMISDGTRDVSVRPETATVRFPPYVSSP